MVQAQKVWWLQRAEIILRIEDSDAVARSAWIGFLDDPAIPCYTRNTTKGHTLAGYFNVMMQEERRHGQAVRVVDSDRVVT